MYFLVKNVTRRTLIVKGRLLRPASIVSRRKLGMKPSERFTRRDSVFLTEAEVSDPKVEAMISTGRLYCERRPRKEGFPVLVKRSLSRRYVPGGSGGTVTFTPASGDIQLPEGGSLVYTATINLEEYAELEVDILINDPQGDLEDKEQFTVYAQEDDPYGSPEARQDFEGRGMAVTFSNDVFSIDFGPGVTADLAASGVIRIYGAVNDANGDPVWGDMNNTTPEMLTTLDITIEEPETEPEEPEDPEPEPESDPEPAPMSVPEPEPEMDWLEAIQEAEDRGALEGLVGEIGWEESVEGLSDTELTNLLYREAALAGHISKEDALTEIEWDVELDAERPMATLKAYGSLFEPEITSNSRQTIVERIIDALVDLGLREEG